MAAERAAEERRVAAEAAGWNPVPVPAPDVRQQADGPTPDAGPPAGRRAALRPAPRHRAVPATMSALVDDAEVADDQLEAIIAPPRGERLTLRV